MNQIQNPVQSLKLDGENWIVWRFQTSVILKGRGLYEFVNGDNPKPTQAEEVSKWLKEDAKAQELLITRMERGPLTNLLSCGTAKDMWSKLKSIYDKESVREIKNKLKQAGEELSEKMVMTKILMSLPERYKHFRSAWESVPIEKQTLDELTSRLLIEEERVKSYEGATAFAGSSTRKETPKKWGGKMKCFVCQKLGHYGKNCYERKESPKTGINKCTNCKKLGHLVADCWFLKKEKNKKDESSIINAFVGASVKLLSDDWCMDTGASEHMCWDERLFETLTESQMERKVKIGDGNMLDVADKNKVECHRERNHKPIENNGSNLIYNDTSEGASLQENESTHESLVEDQVSSDADVESQHEGEEETDIRYNLRKNRQRPVTLNDYETSFSTICEEEEPETFEEAMHTNEATKWKEAIEAEINALQENDTWVCEEDETGENKVIECKWVFKRKKDENGKVVSYKARLIARGFQQTNLYYPDVYSPVAKLPSNKARIIESDTPPPPFTLEELQLEKTNIKNRKAPGQDEMMTETIQLAIDTIPEAIPNVLNTLHRDGIIPEEWKKAKDEDIFEQMLKARLERGEVGDKAGISATQVGFRAGKSTVQAVKYVIEEASRRGPGQKMSGLN
ncbi:hypothetical protein JTB14_016898 [Gonioctena quinquepunctata]|nr:hypothetical protein JTB14_016898 [Gonioctena quinquepunctata]